MSAQRLTLALLVVVIGMVGWALWRQPSVRDIADQLRSDKVNLNITNTWGDTMLVTTVNWRDTNGHTHSTQVTSNKDGGESFPAFSERHLQEVEDFKAKVVAAGGTIL